MELWMHLAKQRKKFQRSIEKQVNLLLRYIIMRNLYKLEKPGSLIAENFAVESEESSRKVY